jgi:hypothetical protein
MKLRWLCVLALWVGTPGAGFADDAGAFRRISCPVVRYYVAKYSASAAEQWARAKGASDAEIEVARRCLTSSTTRTARAPQRPLALGTYGW